MDFSFSFMQGIMGNTIQQPPQLIDSANIRQEDTYDASSNLGENGGRSTYDSALESGFCYPPSAPEDQPGVTNGYLPTMGLYESQTKYGVYSQFPNGSANGYSAIRNYGDHYLVPGEGIVLRAPVVHEKPPPSTPPHPLAAVPPPSNLSKKTGSPEIKLKIIKTYHNGRELFESALCGDLLHEVQTGETSRRRHEHKKEKRKKNSDHHSQNTEPELQKLEQPQGISSVHLGEAVLRGPQPCERREELDTPRNCKVTTGDFKDHGVGDLVWAKVGTYPWWPCMVSRDPQSKVHTRINTRGHQEYHVQFFGSVPERAWIHEKRVVVYQGQHQFDELQAETLRKTSNPVERHKLLKPIPQRERAQWEVGVGHVEDAFLMTREERIENYTFIYVDEVPSGSPPRAAKVGKKARRSRGGGREENSGSPEGEQRSTRHQPRRHEPTEAHQQSPPVKTTWKTAAARKLLPLSVTMKKLNVEMIKCEWPSSREQALSPRRMEVEGWQVCATALAESGDPLPPTGPVERKQQRRSVRSRSESEKGAEPIPKKKLKKEQVRGFPAPLCLLSSIGASEISDSCKPLKKRSRASTDVETASSQYRDTSDSDSRGLSDPQVLFGKGADSPMAADASDTQSVDSSLSRQGGVASKKDTVCQICECYGDALVSCEGECCRLFHLECLGLTSRPDGRFSCLECTNGSHNCFSCKDPGGDMMQCLVSGCGRFYHETCARRHPGTSIEPRGLSCPQHCCATCCLERDMQKASKGRLMRCMRCPIAYHTGDGCIAAGSVMITPHVIVCSNHSSSKRNGHLTSSVNVGWCFVCARGGRLLCCESCPASFHPECLSIEMPEGAWCCSECRAGKRPHYKQIVWVKLGSYRWWPAEICNPRLVPFNIQTLKHDIGEFPVFFFGSHDYYWIGRGRVFPYVESDKNFAEGQMGISKTFKKALEEAAKRFQELKAQRESREALEQERSSRRPPPYKFIKSNKPVGKVQVHVADLSEIPRCNCKPTGENPCGLDSQCLNRMLQYECHSQVCPAGDRCHNQSFSRRLYPETEVIKTEGRGWGLKTKQDLKKGDFVLEYVGELIDSEECRLRIKRAHESRVTNFYMLTLTKDRVIDAGPKGNFSRFMNHSCSPNCETQKWTVNGDVRIGLFALCDIKAETELTFNYNLDCLGNGRTSCHCGAENCSGFLGVRPKSAVVMEKEEKARNAKLKPKKRKLKPESKQIHEYFCFCCGEGGELVMCDKKDCTKAYHLLCLNLTKPPFGRWECPWHQCSVCPRAASSFCHFCPSSFCKDHEQGMLVPSALDGRPCCSAHDPQSPLEPRAADLGQVKVKEEPPEAGE
uniref:Histone-lysine N-methyltransferase NSD3 n=1 Tax=Paramormyrops kingsleyae TaxID=1676925 RepID=A0A3B3R460_9TELE